MDLLLACCGALLATDRLAAIKQKLRLTAILIRIHRNSIQVLCPCWVCNLHKGPNLATLDPVTRELIPLFHPREQNWDEHFRFVGARIDGLTPTGRATARLLKMNDDDQTEIRAALMMRGEL